MLPENRKALIVQGHKVRATWSTFIDELIGQEEDDDRITLTVGQKSDQITALTEEKTPGDATTSFTGAILADHAEALRIFVATDPEPDPK